MSSCHRDDVPPITSHQRLSCETAETGAQGAGLQPLHAGRNETMRERERETRLHGPPTSGPPGELGGEGGLLPSLMCDSVCQSLLPLHLQHHMFNNSILSSVVGLQSDRAIK